MQQQQVGGRQAGRGVLAVACCIWVPSETTCSLVLCQYLHSAAQRKGSFPPCSCPPAPTHTRCACCADDELPGRGSKSFTEDRANRVCALLAAHDNHVWVGRNKGRLERYTAAGRLVWSKVRRSGWGVSRGRAG